MAADLAVEAAGLTKRFGTFVAVDHVDLHIPRGEIFGFLGPNGAGKSTTIRMLVGLLPPSEGRARVLGIDVARDPETVKARVGYMSQRSSLYDDLTPVEVLDFYARVYGLSDAERRQKVSGWIERANLGEVRDALIGTLSGGWRQRLALGCAILHRPPLLLLDEPTSGTDPVQRREFWELIYRFAEEGTTVLVTTHYMDEAEHCTLLALINGGRIVAQGTPERIKAETLRGGVLEVVAEPWSDALAALEQLPEVREPALYGTAIHVGADDPAAVAPLVERFLAQRGLTVRRVARREATLEDVFVSLVAGDAA